MRRYPLALLLAACCTVPALGARAQTAAPPGIQIHVLDVDSPTGGELGRDEPLYVRIEFNTDRPIDLWARPYFAGKEVPGAFMNASQKHTGIGFALGWFSFQKPARVDEIRILASDGTSPRTWEVARYPIDVQWTGQPAPRHAAAPWVAELQQVDQAVQRAATQQASSVPSSVSDDALVSGFMLTMLAIILGSLILPVRALVVWRGGWRVAAAAPVAVMTFVILRIVVDTAADPTSHNLWPFEIVMAGGGALALIALLTLARRITGAARG